MTRAGWRSRGYLPHFDGPDLIQHVIFRLADSLPPPVREEIANAARNERVEAADAALDRGYGRRDLMIAEIGELIQQAFVPV